MKKAALHNLGCKVNAYETEAMQEMLEQNGYEIVPFQERGGCLYYQYMYGDQYGRSEIETDDPQSQKDESGGGGSGSRLLCADSRDAGKTGSGH